MIISANCKINIGLDIVEKRPDGFHNIDTLMLPITGLADTVQIEAANISSLQVIGDLMDCPPEKNLCMKALRLMQRHGAGEASIVLQKRVPSGAGLGGGSSDAAAVIVGANEIFGLGLSGEKLEELASQIGSDIPLFIKNLPVMARGRGEIMTPPDPAILRQLAGKHIVIIKPEAGVSTAEAYSSITPAYPAIPLEERLVLNIDEWSGTILNAFEPLVISKYPYVAALKETLYNMGAVYASMSGSGSAFYGIFDSQPDTSLLPSDIFIYQQVIHTQATYPDKN